MIVVDVRSRALTKEELEDMYWNRGLSTTEISRLRGCGSTTVLNYMRRFGIPRRDRNEALRERSRRIRANLTEDVLRDLYWNKRLSIKRMSELLCVSYGTVYNRMVELGIETRPVGAHMKRLMQDEEYKRKVTRGIRRYLAVYGGPNKGRKLSPEWRQHIREAQRAVLRTGEKNPMFGKVTYPKARYVDSLGHTVRSEWEEIVFMGLRKMGIGYSYEPRRYVFSMNGRKVTWIPDAELDSGEILEIKGPLLAGFLRKLEAFKRSYPEKKVILVVSERDERRAGLKRLKKLATIWHIEDFEGGENRHYSRYEGA